MLELLQLNQNDSIHVSRLHIFRKTAPETKFHLPYTVTNQSSCRWCSCNKKFYSLKGEKKKKMEIPS